MMNDESITDHSAVVEERLRVNLAVLTGGGATAQTMISHSFHDYNLLLKILRPYVAMEKFKDVMRELLCKVKPIETYAQNCTDCYRETSRVYIQGFCLFLMSARTKYFSSKEANDHTVLFDLSYDMYSHRSPRFVYNNIGPLWKFLNIQTTSKRRKL